MPPNSVITYMSVSGHRQFIPQLSLVHQAVRGSRVGYSALPPGPSVTDSECINQSKCPPRLYLDYDHRLAEELRVSAVM